MSAKKTKRARDWTAERRRKNVENGLCRCGRAREEENFKTCVRCRAKTRERRYRYQDKADELGLCHVEGCPNKRLDSLSICSGCRDYRKKRYRTRIENGQCYVCREPVVKNRAACKRHLEAQAQRNADSIKRKIERGLCVSCNSRDLKDGNQRCVPCSKKAVQVKLKHRADRLSKGLCECGTKKMDKNRYYCARCNAKHNIYNRKRRSRVAQGLQEMNAIESLLSDIRDIEKGGMR